MLPNDETEAVLTGVDWQNPGHDETALHYGKGPNWDPNETRETGIILKLDEANVRIVRCSDINVADPDQDLVRSYPTDLMDTVIERIRWNSNRWVPLQTAAAVIRAVRWMGSSETRPEHYWQMMMIPSASCNRGRAA